MCNNIIVLNEEVSVLSRRGALKYKEVLFKDINTNDFISIVSNDDVLEVHKAEMSDTSETVYTFVTKEFGLHGSSHGVKSKIKINFCDNGYMIVTIYDGSIIIKRGDDLLNASLNTSQSLSVDTQNILWVSAEDILSNLKFIDGFKGTYTQDFEYMLEVSGELKNDLRNFHMRVLKDETIDISGGIISMMEERLRQKEEAIRIQQGINSVLNQSLSSSVDDDDDDYDDDYDDDDYDEDDYEDYDYEDDDDYWDDEYDEVI